MSRWCVVASLPAPMILITIVNIFVVANGCRGLFDAFGVLVIRNVIRVGSEGIGPVVGFFGVLYSGAATDAAGLAVGVVGGVTLVIVVFGWNGKYTGKEVGHG